MPQELILQIQHYYPFGQNEMENPQERVFARKRFEYSTQESYKKISQKITIIKKLKHPIIIPLIRILEEEGSFHLIYEYIPYKFNSYLEKLTNDEIESLKKQLLLLSQFLCENKIDINFESKNVGFSKSMELKYYLDIDFIILERGQQAIKNKNVLQINKIFQNIKMYTDKNDYISKGHFSQKRQNLLLTDESKSNRIRFKNNNQLQLKSNRIYSPPYVQPFNSSEREDSKYTSYQSKYKQKSIWTTKSKEISKPLAHQAQLLSNLQSKIQQIRKNFKKCNIRKPVLQERKAELRESTREKQLTKQKSNDRKMSVQISPVSSFGKNSIVHTDTAASSVRNHKIVVPSVILQNIKQNSEESQNNLGTGNTPMERKQSIKFRKQSIKHRKESIKSITHRKESSRVMEPANNQKYQLPSQIPPAPQIPVLKLKTSPSFREDSTRPKKQPLTKRDFQQLKKNQFQSFFNSKQSYVQEFLGVLDDQNDPPTITTSKPSINLGQQSPRGSLSKIPLEKTSRSIIAANNQRGVKSIRQKDPPNSTSKLSDPNINSYPSSYSTIKSSLPNSPNSKQKFLKSHKSNPSYEQVYSKNNTNNYGLKIDKNVYNNNANNELIFSQNFQKVSTNIKNNLDIKNVNLSPQPSNQNINFPKKIEKITEKTQLKNRISKALQKCDLAFQNYRKLSINNISTQFLKK